MLPVPREHRGQPAQGNRGGEGGHPKTQVQPTAKESRGQQDPKGGVNCVHRWSGHTRTQNKGEGRKVRRRTQRESYGSVEEGGGRQVGRLAR